MKVKKWRHHLLMSSPYDDVINFFLTRKCQKTRNLQNNMRNFYEIFRKDVTSIESHKKTKQDFTLSLEYTNLELFFTVVTTTVKIWSERNLSKISDFLILGTGESFCFSSFLSFLNIKLQQLSKFEVRERFPRYPSFLFWV